MTGDEKWIFYNNIKCRRSWSNRGGQNTSRESYAVILMGFQSPGIFSIASKQRNH